MFKYFKFLKNLGTEILAFFIIWGKEILKLLVQALIVIFYPFLILLGLTTMRIYKIQFKPILKRLTDQGWFYSLIKSGLYKPKRAD